MSLNPRPSDSVYWDLAALRAETQRVFEVCHGCRRCWNLCPSFGNLFKRIDKIEDENERRAEGAAQPEPPAGAPVPSGGSAVPWRLKPEGEHAASDPSLLLHQDPVQGLTGADADRVVDECYQCKLCYNHCPYHPPHRFLLDFPRLMQRHKAVRLREGRGRWSDRLFARVDLLGTVSCWFAPMVNWANRQRPLRVVLEALMGIHRDRSLPEFAREKFRSWWAWRGPKGRRAERVVLFYTCSVDYNDPGTGRAAVAALERNGFEVVCPPQACCGMPHLDGGDLEAAKSAARRNLARLLPLVQQGLPVVALGPSCSLMLKEEYVALLGDEASRLVAKNTYDIMEFLARLHKKGRLDLDFSPLPGRIAYQAPCHLKAQNIGLKSKEVLELIPGAEVAVVDRCSAHDGTWSLKTEYFELSMKTGQRLFDEIEAAAPAVVCTDCPLAGVQIAQGTGRKTQHPIKLVARAYGIDADRPF